MPATTDTAPSHYAIEGSAMHKVGEQALVSGKDAAAFIGSTPLDVEIDEWHAAAVQVYLDAVRHDQLIDGGDLYVEHSFDLGNLWPGLHGTNDACLISQRLLRVYDLKGGAGVPVEVKENKQLLIYGVGAMRTLQTKYEFDEVELVIVQPRRPHRDGPVRRWRISVVDLLDFTSKLHDALSATMDPSAPLIAGDHCLWCRAKPRCPAFRDWTFAQARMDFDGGLPVPTLMSDEEVADMLTKLDMIDEFVRSVKTHALALAEGGHKIHGYKLVAKRAVRKWKIAESAVRRAFHARGYTDDVIMELKSPRQIERSVQKGDRPLVENMVDRISSGHNLVPDVDVRGAVRSTIEEDFA